MLKIWCGSAHDAVAMARLFYDMGHDVAAYSSEMGTQHGVLCGRAASQCGDFVMLEFDPANPDA